MVPPPHELCSSVGKTVCEKQMCLGHRGGPVEEFLDLAFLPEVILRTCLMASG